MYTRLAARSSHPIIGTAARHVCYNFASVTTMSAILQPVHENLPAASEHVLQSTKRVRMEGIAPLQVLRKHPEAKLPVRGSAGAAGYDLSRHVHLNSSWLTVVA
jgi:hypothetical protein